MKNINLAYCKIKSLLCVHSVLNMNVRYTIVIIFLICTNSEAYSSSLDGTVIAWNVSTLKVNHVFQLPCQNLTSIKLHNDQLWCCKFIPQIIKKNKITSSHNTLFY